MVCTYFNFKKQPRNTTICLYNMYKEQSLRLIILHGLVDYYKFKQIFLIILLKNELTVEYNV